MKYLQKNNIKKKKKKKKKLKKKKKKKKNWGSHISYFIKIYSISIKYYPPPKKNLFFEIS